MPEPIDWTIERLAKRHDRAAFGCGVEDLDDYFHKFVSQNERHGVSQHYIAVPGADKNRVLGYYALSAGSVAFNRVPEDLRKRLPRYPIPVAHMGRLAVDQSMQKQGLGEHLLIDALRRIVSVADEIGIHAVEVVAINRKAKQFYLRYGFTPLLDDKQHLYLPLKVVRQLGLI